VSACHRKGVTTEALAAILRVAREQPGESLSSWQINSFFQTEYAQVSDNVELALSDGGRFSWNVCRLDRLLRHRCRNSAGFAAALSEAVAKAHPNPLSSVWYLDEVVPGNILRPDNQRKFWAIYVSVAEFGNERLCGAEWWLPIAILRSSVANQVLGGVSQRLRQLLRHTLLAPCEWRKLSPTKRR